MYQCSQCLKSLAVCECVPDYMREIQHAVFGEEPIRPELSPEAAAQARQRVQQAVATHGKVFVQNAWRRVVEGIPDGYTPVKYPKWQFHPDGRSLIVETLEDHSALYADDARWTEPPVDDLLAMFFKELQ